MEQCRDALAGRSWKSVTCKQILLLQTHPGSTMGSFPTVAFGGWQEPSRRIFPLFPTQISQQL